MEEYEESILEKIKNNIPLTKIEENYQLLRLKLFVEKGKEVKEQKEEKGNTKCIKY